MKLVIALALVILGCSSGSSSGDCDAIGDEIRAEAIKRNFDGNNDGKPDAEGVCTSTRPDIQRDFAASCAKLKECRE